MAQAKNIQKEIDRYQEMMLTFEQEIKSGDLTQTQIKSRKREIKNCQNQIEKRKAMLGE